MNLIELADQNYEMFGEYTSLIYQDKTYTNVDLSNAAIKLGSSLLKIGITPGDKVLVMLSNCPEVLISYQGILRAGAIIIPTIFLLSAKEVAHILDNSEAVAVITSKAFLPTVKEAGRDVRTLKHVIVIDDEFFPETTKFNDLIEQGDSQNPRVAIKDEDTAVILYTSGTTGLPKGVILTHRNLYFNAVSAIETKPSRTKEVVLFVLPLSHSFGLTVMNTMMKKKELSILMPWFDLETACQLIEKYKVTDFAGVPAMFAMFMNQPEITEKYDLSSLKQCASGSAPLPREILSGFENNFCPIYEGYGLSEASPVVTVHYLDRKRKAGSIGQPIPGVDLKIVDKAGNSLGVGDVGEMLVKGLNISQGYYKLPEETAHTFKDGWLNTGDLARVDEDGYVFIEGRKKDLIIRGGFNIVPRDVEEVLFKHPSVIDVAVIGVPDPSMGEEIKAFVVRKEEISVEDIIFHCEEHLAKYKCPKYVIFVDSLPKTAMGKVLRRKLREEG